MLTKYVHLFLFKSFLEIFKMLKFLKKWTILKIVYLIGTV